MSDTPQETRGAAAADASGYPAGPACAPSGGARPADAPSAGERVRVAAQRRGESDYIFSYWSALGWNRTHPRNTGFTSFTNSSAGCATTTPAGSNCSTRRPPSPGSRPDGKAVTRNWRAAFQRAAGHLAVLRRMTSDFREPVIWLVLAIVARGIDQIVAFVLLDQDLIKHGQAEAGAERELSVIYDQLGQQLASADPNRVKRPDNYVGRIVAAIFSFGIYMFWWYYNQMEEPNRHFAGNWAQEDELVKAVAAFS